jgi:hypothetical protein
MWAYSAATCVLVLLAVLMLLTETFTSQFLHGLIA